MAENVYDRINDYGSVRISLASPNDIRSWSFGEVKKPETINYRTYRAEKDGLFCERIFGPERDWECFCGKYRGTKHKGMICDRCGVKVTHSRVRRKRMGHINLAAPVVHIWFFKAVPSRLGTLLAMKTSDLEKVVYFQDYVVIENGETPLKKKQVLSEEEYRAALEKYGANSFTAEMGAESVKKLLANMDMEKLSVKLRADLRKTNSKQKIKDITKRLKIIEALRGSTNDPQWMVMDVIPVIPPDLRPLVMLESGNFATSDLNDLYRRIINRNNRLKKLMDLNAPEVIIRNEKRMLQQAVDALFDNGRCRRPVLGSSNRPLKSLTDMIKGKQGRFRENLLGKRVDYSARSVIVVGPELKLNQCGLPKKIALELYQPFIIRKLKDRGLADTIKSAKRMLERKDDEVWDILEEVIHQHPVLLNRAPTLHRMGIQAFEPVLIEGNAIKIHPLVCKGFNADFDGDQMAVHLPLSIEAQAEAHVLMLATNNIFSPASGAPIMSPSQDIVLGCYYLTCSCGGEPGEGMAFAGMHEALLAHNRGALGMHARVKVRIQSGKQVVEKDRAFVPERAIVETSVGRLIFNDILPPQMPFYNYPLSQKGIARVISDCYAICGRSVTIDLLDAVKELGFKRATLAGLSFGVVDVKIPPRKNEIIEAAQKRADKIDAQYRAGAITDIERRGQLLDVWVHAREEVSAEMMKSLGSDTRNGKPYLNPIFLMSDSGARGSADQIRQLAGMRGLMAKPSGEIIETPIKANFREGLTVLEYFSSTHGARKGLADTALKTADSGYLTRKLADVAQNVVIMKHDCETIQGVTKKALYKGETVDVPLRDLIVGRTALQTILDPKTDEKVVGANELITPKIAERLEELNVDAVRVRSPLTCESPLGICACCYGQDLSTGQLVEEGMAVGIIAAQSIGEPGTQLTMRTFHTGGIATRSVMETQTLAGVAGTIKWRDLNAVQDPSAFKDKDAKKPVEGALQKDGKPVPSAHTVEAGYIVLKRQGEIAIVDQKDRELEKYKVQYGAHVLVKDGQQVKVGQRLVWWDPHRVPILAEVGGFARFEDIEEGETVRIEQEGKSKRETGRLVVIEHKGEKHPRVVIEDKDGKILDFHYLPAKARIEVKPGQKINPGDLLARQPREIKGTADITGGLPRVTELFEARKPRDPAVMTEISGSVALRSDKRRGKMTITVTPSGAGLAPKEHHVPRDRHLLVHAGDYVEAGDPLIDGPMVPHDILRIKGEEALYNYMLAEIQSVYRAQTQRINDKHIEIILSQMTRKIRIENPGDSEFLPGEVLDKFRFREGNEELSKKFRIVEPGETGLGAEQLVGKAELEEINVKAEEEGKQPAKGRKPKPANAKTLLLGITKASLQSESFIAAASFQETTKVLTEAALAGKEDTLIGLKENVILGHLVPAGTGFKPSLSVRVKHLVAPLPAPGEVPDLTEEERAAAQALQPQPGGE